MPIITLEAGKISKEQKAELVKGFVEKASQVLGIPEQAFVTIIRENDMDNIGSGSKLLSDVMGERK